MDSNRKYHCIGHFMTNHMWCYKWHYDGGFCVVRRFLCGTMTEGWLNGKRDDESDQIISIIYTFIFMPLIKCECIWKLLIFVVFFTFIMSLQNLYIGYGHIPYDCPCSRLFIRRCVVWSHVFCHCLIIIYPYYNHYILNPVEYQGKNPIVDFNLTDRIVFLPSSSVCTIITSKETVVDFNLTDIIALFRLIWNDATWSVWPS